MSDELSWLHEEIKAEGKTHRVLMPNKQDTLPQYQWQFIVNSVVRNAVDKYGPFDRVRIENSPNLRKIYLVFEK